MSNNQFGGLATNAKIMLILVVVVVLCFVSSGFAAVIYFMYGQKPPVKAKPVSSGLPIIDDEQNSDTIEDEDNEQNSNIGKPPPFGQPFIDNGVKDHKPNSDTIEDEDDKPVRRDIDKPTPFGLPFIEDDTPQPSGLAPTPPVAPTVVKKKSAKDMPLPPGLTTTSYIQNLINQGQTTPLTVCDKYLFNTNCDPAPEGCYYETGPPTYGRCFPK